MFVRLFFADSGQGSGEWPTAPPGRTQGTTDPRNRQREARVTNAGKYSIQINDAQALGVGSILVKGHMEGIFEDERGFAAEAGWAGISRRESPNSKGSEAAKCGVRGRSDQLSAPSRSFPGPPQDTFQCDVPA